MVEAASPEDSESCRAETSVYQHMLFLKFILATGPIIAAEDFSAIRTRRERAGYLAEGFTPSESQDHVAPEDPFGS